MADQAPVRAEEEAAQLNGSKDRREHHYGEAGNPDKAPHDPVSPPAIFHAKVLEGHGR